MLLSTHADQQPSHHKQAIGRAWSDGVVVIELSSPKTPCDMHAVLWCDGMAPVSHH